jgi:hypothetical protein
VAHRRSTDARLALVSGAGRYRLEQLRPLVARAGGLAGWSFLVSAGSGTSHSRRLLAASLSAGIVGSSPRFSAAERPSSRSQSSVAASVNGPTCCARRSTRAFALNPAGHRVDLCGTESTRTLCQHPRRATCRGCCTFADQAGPPKGAEHRLGRSVEDSLPCALERLWPGGGSPHRVHRASPGRLVRAASCPTGSGSARRTLAAWATPPSRASYRLEQTTGCSSSRLGTSFRRPSTVLRWLADMSVPRFAPRDGRSSRTLPSSP